MNGRTYVDFTHEWECERLALTVIVTAEAEFSRDSVPSEGFGNSRSYETACFLEDVAIKGVQVAYGDDEAKDITLEELRALPLTSEERKDFWESVDEAALAEGLE